MKQVRCAIYTRKSSDEGLEQAFNSLDAQREACAAYILSQASEGWLALPEVYDDGGLSGGTLERPALRRLLAEVAENRIDIIVVYKVDRLTRSLFDFAKLVETFDATNTSFVSVTQSFNTTTSMGRLTLNMLLSFAQFEREVTAERIRDKIAASKAKGMWMGGTPPLGYCPDGRTLAVVGDHASIVTHVFARYLALGNVRLVEQELAADGIVNPVRARTSGAAYGGGAIGRGQIYKLLTNPVYTGRIQHGEQSYAGLHAAIVDPDLWEQVQARLAEQRQGARTKVRVRAPSLLVGLVTDAAGDPLIASHAIKGTQRYRYYLSKALNETPGATGLRIPALELEYAVGDRVAAAFDDPITLAGTMWLELVPAAVPTLAARAGMAAAALRARERASTLAQIAAVRVHPDRIEVDCHSNAIAAALGLATAADAPATITLTSPVMLTRSGRAMRLVRRDGAALQVDNNASLVRMVNRARGWWRQLREGQLGIREIAAAEGVQPSYVTRVLRLAFLSPQVVDALLAGTLRAGVGGTALTLRIILPACWRAQTVLLLPRPEPRTH